MVRLMLVRHAQSFSNEYMESVMERLRQHEIKSKEFNRFMRNAPPGSRAYEDANLTPLGKVQANKFGHTWAPLLASKAKAGKLLVLVSPFTRTLDTADPFMKMLGQIAPEIKALVCPMIMEVAGLTTFEDMKHLDEIDDLISQGRREDAIALLKSVKWSPAGLSGDEILQRYSWATLDNRSERYMLDKDVQLDITKDKPWWNLGYEAKNRANTRINALTDWIIHSKSNFPDDTVILLVSHGETIEKVVNKLLHVSFTSSDEYNQHVLFTGIRNTSMTCLHLPSQDFDFSGTRPASDGENLKYKCLLEFFNDTSHLGTEQLAFHSINYLDAHL